MSYYDLYRSEGHGGDFDDFLKWAARIVDGERRARDFKSKQEAERFLEWARRQERAPPTESA